MKSSVVNTIIVHYLCRKLVQELSYDAWGRLRDPETRELYGLEDEPTPMFGRGFTGHEHIVGFRLVNMNARLYDPMTGRMLSPDPIVQSPYFSQNHNRHSYCLNNPLAFTDPTGMKIVYDMTDEEKAEWDEYINSIDENSPFIQLLEILDKEKQIITIEFGETNFDSDKDQCPGQFNSANYTITFLEGKNLDYRIIVEELYHAYQEIFAYLMKDQIWNREFEAKLVARIITYYYGGQNELHPQIDLFFEMVSNYTYQGIIFFNNPLFSFLYKYNGSIFTKLDISKNFNYNTPVNNVPKTFYKFMKIIL